MSQSQREPRWGETRTASMAFHPGFILSPNRCEGCHALLRNCKYPGVESIACGVVRSAIEGLGLNPDGPGFYESIRNTMSCAGIPMHTLDSNWCARFARRHGFRPKKQPASAAGPAIDQVTLLPEPPPELPGTQTPPGSPAMGSGSDIRPSTPPCWTTAAPSINPPSVASSPEYLDISSPPMSVGPDLDSQELGRMSRKRSRQLINLVGMNKRSMREMSSMRCRFLGLPQGGGSPTPGTD